MKPSIPAILIGLCAVAAYASLSPEEPTVTHRLPHVVVTLSENGGVVIEANVPIEIRLESPPESRISSATRRTAAAFRAVRTIASALLHTAKTVYSTHRPGAAR